MDADSAPNQLTVRYEYPARGDKPAVTLTWSVGVNRPDNYEQDKMPDWKEGVVFVGEKGMLVANFTRYQLLPEAQFADFKLPESAIRKSVSHHKEFVKACKDGGATSCTFDYSGVLTQAVLLGNIAYRSGRKIEWNAAGMKIPNAPEAERYLRRSYRKGWSL